MEQNFDLPRHYGTPSPSCNFFSNEVERLLAQLGKDLSSLYASVSCESSFRERVGGEPSKRHFDDSSAVRNTTAKVLSEWIDNGPAHLPDVEFSTHSPNQFKPDVTHRTEPRASTSSMESSIQKNQPRKKGSVMSVQGAAMPKNISKRSWISFSTLSETSPILLTWNAITSCIILLTVWSDTLALAQDWDATGCGPLGPNFDWMATVLLSADILLQFHVSYEDGTGYQIQKRSDIAKRYVKGWFFFDVLVTIPYEVFMGDAEDARAAAFGKILKLPKAVRVVKLHRLLFESQTVVHCADKVEDLIARFVDYTTIQAILRCGALAKAILQYFTLLFVESHLATCFTLGLSRSDSMSFEFQAVNVDALSPLLRYFVALRWTLVGLATGSTDGSALQFALPHYDPQILQVAITTIFASNFMCALALFANVKGSDDMDFHFQLRAVDIYLRKNECISNFIRKRILDFHRAQATRNNHQAVRKLLSDLPDDLRVRLSFETFGRDVHRFPLFQQGPFADWEESRDLLLALCCLLKSRFLTPNEFLVMKGDILEGMYVKMDGTLVETCVDMETRRFSKSDIVGSTVPQVRVNFELRDAILNRGEKAGPSQTDLSFIGIEALIAPCSGDWQKAETAVLSVTCSECAVVRRDLFDSAVKTRGEWDLFIQFVRRKFAEQQVSVFALAHDGLSEEMLVEYEQTFRAHGGDVSSEDLGVCLQYLVDVFRADVAEEHGIEDFNATTFRTLRHEFWGQTHAGFRGSACGICPRDGGVGCAIVDCLDDCNSSMATHFVSWCWVYGVDAVIESLASWSQVQGISTSMAFLWMCFFCNNQRKFLIERVVETDLEHTFGQRLSKIGRMVVLVDKFNKPTYTTRLWCIFEAYTATVNDIPMDVALPPASNEEFRQILKAPRGFSNLVGALTDIDTESATASVQEDEIRIKKLISSTTGFGVVDHTVKLALTRWLASAFEKCLAETSGRRVSLNHHMVNQATQTLNERKTLNDRPPLSTDGLLQLNAFVDNYFKGLPIAGEGNFTIPVCTVVDSPEDVTSGKNSY